MISIKNLRKRYDDLIALDNLDLEVGKGVLFGLLGPNGAGKTTLVSILNGLAGFQEGEIEIFGLPLAKNIDEIRQRTAFIPQSLALYENLSVIENLRFFAGIQKITGARLRSNLDYTISVNRLQPMLKQKAATLSGGQKRRLNIAIGLLNNPELLYFDEPTIGIDPDGRNEILETIQAFKNDAKTVIYTSHYMAEIEKICDEVAIIDRGRIIRQGLLATLLQEEGADSAVIELMHANENWLHKLSQRDSSLEVVDAVTLVMHCQDSKKMGRLLGILEAEQIAIKHIRFAATNLETLFIRLTSSRVSDV